MARCPTAPAPNRRERYSIRVVGCTDIPLSTLPRLLARVSHVRSSERRSTSRSLVQSGGTADDCVIVTPHSGPFFLAVFLTRPFWWS